MLITDHFARLAPGYDIVLSDVWGVIHNGVAAFPAASEALTNFRQKGGAVVLISNAPRPGNQVIRMLDRMGVPHAAYDAIVTSGDVTRDMVAQRAGEPFFLIGPERDHSIFEGLDAPFSTIAAAKYVICTGLFDDEVETPEDYREMLEQLRARNLFMVCANPDIVVERGHRLIYCAGALADAYAALGGKVLYCGKPHPPIYDLALATATALRNGKTPYRERVLAIGDSVRTDLKGAASFGLDCMFVTSGIHAEEYGSREAPDLAALNAMFVAGRVKPRG